MVQAAGGRNDAAALGLALQCRWRPLRDAARGVLETALRRAGGSIGAAALELGVNRNTVGDLVNGDAVLAKLRASLLALPAAEERASAGGKRAAGARWKQRGRPPKAAP